MNKFFPFLTLLLVATLFPFQNGLAQSGTDTVHVSICPKFWKTGVPVQDVTLSTNPANPLAPFSFQYDSASTCALLSFVPSDLPLDYAFTFAGEKNSDAQNGVNILDLTCILQHILGLEPLPAYGTIAADANHSGSVTSFDVRELRRLLLYVYDTLPYNTSWIFVDASYVFLNPNNPFQPSIHSLVYPADQLTDGDTITLLGIKIGDVDGDANPAGPYKTLNTLDSVTLNIPDQWLTPGELVSVQIQLNAHGLPIYSVQGAFNFDTTLLELIEIVNTPYADAENFGLFKDKFSFATRQRKIPENQSVMVIKFQAKGAATLKNALTLNPGFVYPLASGEDCDQPYKLGATFTNLVAQQEPFDALSVRLNPNPFQQKAWLSLELQQSAWLRLEVFDALGRLTYSLENKYPAGAASLEIPGSALAAGSGGFYRLSSGSATATGKLYRQR